MAAKSKPRRDADWRRRLALPRAIEVSTTQPPRRPGRRRDKPPRSCRGWFPRDRPAPGKRLFSSAITARGHRRSARPCVAIGQLALVRRRVHHHRQDAVANELAAQRGRKLRSANFTCRPPCADGCCRRRRRYSSASASGLRPCIPSMKNDCVTPGRVAMVAILLRPGERRGQQRTAVEKQPSLHTRLASCAARPV